MRYMDQLAITQSETFREGVEDAFRVCLDAKVELQQATPSRRANVLGRHMNGLSKELHALLRESCEVYSAIALACSGEMGSNLLAWVKERIEADFALACDEQRIYGCVIAACDGSGSTRYVNATEWLGPAWLGFAWFNPRRTLRGDEVKGQMDVRRTQSTLKRIHLRLWTRLSRAVYQALFKANQRIEFERKHDATHIPEKRTRTGSDSVRRAQWVATIFGELNAFRAEMQIPQDYEDYRSKHPKFKIFKLAAKHSSFKGKLIAIREHRQLTRLAQDAAALNFKRKLSTIQTDWKRSKPISFRRPLSAN
jgi:hypothetical protein